MTAPRNLSRRTALTTIGALAAVPALGTGAVGACSASASSEGAQRYVGVVDRIVDGRHVVVLLEDGNRVVDQLVVDVDEFDEIAPRDILLVILEDGELARYRHLPEKPASTGRA